MENNLIPPQNLPPFLKFCYTVGILPTSYRITWTYEEQVLECIRFIKEEIIPVVNKNAMATTELQEKFVELVNYVETYFDNLDLQSEINTKLDEMAEDGTLAEIINQEIFGELNAQVAQNTEDIAKIKGFYVNVNSNGIANDGTDVSTELQELIDSYPLGATFYFANGTYKFKNIELNNNTTILGDTDTNFVVDDDEICEQFLIDNKTNVEIKNCNFRNGTTNEQNLIGGATANQKTCIFLEDATNIKILNCKFNIISGCSFIYGIDTEYMTIEDCSFKNSAYAMILKVSNCKHWYINRNSFEDLYTGSTGNSYAIASGVLDFISDSGFAEDIHITNNVFKNHKHWETIDSHGGCDYYIENNQFYECYQAIAIFDDERPARRFDMRNINITGNYIEVTGTLDDFIAQAITVRGNNTTYKQVVGGKISNNRIVSTNKNATAGIYLRYASDFEISNNYLYGLHYYPMSIIQVLNTTISSNTLDQCASLPTSANGRTADFLFEFAYNIAFENNRAFSDDLPYYAVQLQNYCLIFANELNNMLQGRQDGLYHNKSSYSDRFGKIGLYKYTYGYPYTRATNVPLQSTATANVLTINTTEDSDIVETSVNALTKLAIGENIKIVGGGVEVGEDLEAMFVEFIDGTHIRLSKPMNHTASNVQVDTLAAVWQALSLT